jgi:uridine kinase
VDGWLNPPSLRFARERLGERFYEHAIRFEDMFRELVLPLRRARSIRIEVDQITETATEHHRHAFVFDDVDVILLEGIFLLKRVYGANYGLARWVECSFETAETALARAVGRAQEGLAPADTVRGLRDHLHPRPRLHLALDVPQAAAGRILGNDPERPAGRL